VTNTVVTEKAIAKIPHYFRLSRGLETGFLTKILTIYPKIMKETRFLCWNNRFGRAIPKGSAKSAPSPTQTYWLLGFANSTQPTI